MTKFILVMSLVETLLVSPIHIRETVNVEMTMDSNFVAFAKMEIWVSYLQLLFYK